MIAEHLQNWKLTPGETVGEKSGDPRSTDIGYMELVASNVKILITKLKYKRPSIRNNPNMTVKNPSPDTQCNVVDSLF